MNREYNVLGMMKEMEYITKERFDCINKDIRKRQKAGYNEKNVNKEDRRRKGKKVKTYLYVHRH